MAALLAQFAAQVLALPWATRVHRETAARAGPFRAAGDWRAGVVVPVVGPLLHGAMLVAAHAALAPAVAEWTALPLSPLARGAALALLLWLVAALPQLLLDYARFRVSLLAAAHLAWISLAGAAAAGLALGVAQMGPPDEGKMGD